MGATAAHPTHQLPDDWTEDKGVATYPWAVRRTWPACWLGGFATHLSRLGIPVIDLDDLDAWPASS